MADALISSLMDQLASTAFEPMKLDSEVKKSIEDFDSILKRIHIVLRDAEKRGVVEYVVQAWLDKVTQVAYDMDDVLDEWNTEILKQEVEKQENKGESIQRKVRFSIPSPCNCFSFGQVSRVVVSYGMALKIKQLNSELILIDKDRERYGFQSTTTCDIEQPQRAKTSSLVDVSMIFGRENEKHTLISMLLGHSTTSEEERGPLVISVVGMGGMGKTTLAQLAYNDEIVKGYFDKSKWVCVSDPFDEIKIAKAMINDNDTPVSDEMDALMQVVSKSVQGKRFLLVLDDVWTKDDTKWKPLKLALMSSAEGSKILVTTRNETVARMMGATTHMIQLDKLSEQNCSSLFYDIALLDRKKDKALEAIGDKIVKKCDGLPLAVKILGSLMRNKNRIKEWHDVLDSEMWEIEAVHEKVFRSLLLSYYDLPPKIKPCLLFCASFPKDYQFEKDKLIELWMSQNYINSKKYKSDKRSIGQHYFDSLVMRFFFRDFKCDATRNLALCKMDYIVHDFVRFLTRNECFIIESNGANEATPLPSDSVHHLTLMLAAEGPLSLPLPFQACQKLRSLTILGKEITTIDRDLILQGKCLRAFNLSKSNVKELPKEIGELLHLRYIDLSYNYSLKELPDAICNLCNLETLHLEWCGLEKLPEAMGKLINLKHLYIDQCSQLSCLPKGLGRLKGLRILGKYAVVQKGLGDDKKKLELGDLGTFVQLQGTPEIAKLGNVKDVREGQKEQL